MADHHQLVDQIRAFVQSSDQTLTPRLEELAKEYADACVSINTRLSRCQRLLQQGLRSEAIQSAESEPKLLDVIAALDFPERPEWDEIASLYGLPAAPPMSIEAAGFLNEAYALEDPLRELLRTHRRLALLRAPLVDRIAVLRKLAAQDSTNPIWSDDQRTFEKVRFRQIQAEATDAARRHDVAWVGRLLAELDHSLWVEPPPPSLVQGLRKADSQLRGRQTRASLAEVEGELSDAFASKDSFRAREIRRRWQSLIDREQIPADDPLRVRVAPIFAWLREEDHREEDDRGHEAAVQELLATLDAPGRIGPAELERLGNQVLRYERGMSESIRHQFLERLGTERDFVSVRNKRISAGVFAALALVLGTGLYFLQRQSRLGEASRAATALADMVELGEIENAGDFLKRLTAADPSLLETSPMLEARTKFQAAQDKEAERQLKFDAAMRETEKADLAVVNPPSLETARSLVRMETEKKAIERLVKRRADELAAEQGRRNVVLSPRLAELEGKLKSIEQTLANPGFPEADQVSLAGQIADFQLALSDLGKDLRLAGSDVQAKSATMAIRLENARGLLDRRREMRRMEDELTGSLHPSDPKGKAFERYASLMSDYAKKFPDTPRARAFASTVKEKPIWESIEAWNQLVAMWASEEKTMTLDRARIHGDQCVKFLAAHSRFPEPEIPDGYRRYLEAITRRDGAEGSSRKRLIQLLSDLLVDNIWMIKYKDPQVGDYRFYLTKPYDGSSNLISYLVGFDGKERVRSIVKQFIVSTAWSPQTRIARKYRPTIADDSIVTRWDDTMLDLLSAIRKESDLDPLLQVALLRKASEYAGDGSPHLARALEPITTRLKDNNVDVNVPWMDPGSTDAGRSRRQAEAMIELISPSDLDKIGSKLKDSNTAAERRISQSMTAVGWLRSDNGTWSLQLAKTIQADSALWVAVFQGENKSLWEQVGEFKGGKVASLVTSEPRGEGRPVFIRQFGGH